MINRSVFAATALAGMTLGAAATAQQNPTNPNYVSYPEPSLIQRDLGALGWVIRRNYDKYIDYKSPNGGSILLVATNDVSDEQLLRANNILEFYLTEVPDAQYGMDKAAVANAMAANGAVLVMPGGSDGNSTVWSWALAGQPWYPWNFRWKVHRLTSTTTMISETRVLKRFFTWSMTMASAPNSPTGR